MCDYDGIDMEDWEIIGPMSEDIANEKRERYRLYRHIFSGDEDDPIYDEDDVP